MRHLVSGARALMSAILVAFAILAVGQGLWGALVFANTRTSPDLPWAPPLMAVLLALLVAGLGGWIGPRRGAAARRRMMALRPVALEPFGWAVFAGLAGVAACANLWIVLTRLLPTPPNLLADPAAYPPQTLLAVLVMSVVAAPVSEELAFRGFAWGLLRKAFGPVATLMIVTTLFTLAHLTQGAYPAKLVVYFLAGLAFGLIAWRSGSLIPAMIVHAAADLAFFTLVWPGDAHRALIADTGADPAFWAQCGAAAMFGGISVWGFARLIAATSPAGEGRNPVSTGIAPAAV